MNINSITGYTTQIAQIRANENTAKKTAAGEEKTFYEVTEMTMDAASKTSKSGAVKSVSTADMTMDEYKSYVHQRIDHMVQNRHPSQALSSYAINISDEAFEAMKNDPEYEDWVFNEALKKNLDFNDPWNTLTGGSYHILNIGPTKETSNGQSWYVGYQKGHGGDIFDARTKNSFYKNRVDTSAAEKKMQDYWAEKENGKRRRLQEEWDEIFFQRRETQKHLQDMWIEKQYESKSGIDAAEMFAPSQTISLPGLF